MISDANINRILNYLDTPELVKASMMSKKWNDIFRNNISQYYINLSFVKNISGPSLSYFKGAKYVDLHCTDINDSDLSFFKGVHTINLSHCQNITNNGLLHLKGDIVFI